MLNGSILTLSWIPPFTLDIPRVNPDVEYCISIESVERRSYFLNTCDIAHNAFTYDLHKQPNGKYSVTVTPVNILGKGEEGSIVVSWDKSKERKLFYIILISV